MKKKVAVVVLVALVLLVTTVSAGVPVVTSWWNDYTSDNSTTFVISYTDNRTVFFNATANQSIDYWVWYVDGVSYQNSSADNVTYTWEEGGDKTVSVYGINVNGQTSTLSWSIEIENNLYEQNQLLIEENQMIGTTMLFGIVVLIALFFLVIAVFEVGHENYFDILSAFVSPTILILLGFKCYTSETLQQFEFLGLLFVVIAVIIYIYGIIKVVSIAIDEFGYGEREEDRGSDYEYK